MSHDYKKTINKIGIGAGNGFHVVIAADREELAVAQREGLRPGSDRVHRVDEAVLVHNIGFTGLLLAKARLVAELNKSWLSGPLLAYAYIDLLHFAALLVVVCVAVLIAVGFTAPAPDRARPAGWTHATSETSGEATTELFSDPSRRARDELLTGALVVLVAAVCAYFTG